MKSRKILILLQFFIVSACSQKQVPSDIANTNPPVQLAILAPQEPLIEGMCSKEHVVKTLDRNGVSAKVGYDQTFRLTSSSQNILFFTDSACSAQAQTKAIRVPANETQSVFYVKSLKAEYVTYVVSGNNYSAAAESRNSISQNASMIKVFGQQTLKTGLCSDPIRIEALNYKGEISPQSENLLISLSGGGLGRFYSDPTCSQQSISSISILSGQSGVPVYFRANKTSSYNLIFTAPGPISTNLSIETFPGNPEKISIASSPKTLVAGNCTDNYEVSILDELGNPTSSISSMTFGLSGTDLKFYKSVGCSGQEINEISVPQGQSSFSFYVKGLKTTSDKITVSGLGPVQNQTITILPGIPARLKFSSIQAQATAGSTLDRVKINIEDNFGNITGSNKRVSVSAFRDSQCSIPADQIGGITSASAISGVASFSTLGYSKAESIYILASSDGLSGSCSPLLKVFPDFATKLLVTGPIGVQVNSCNPLKIESTDKLGNISPLESSSVVYTELMGNSKLYSDSECSQLISNFTIQANSAEKTVYIKDSKVENLGINFYGVGSSFTRYNLNVVPAGASSFQLDVPQSVIAGGCSSGFTIRAVDEFGNESAVQEEKLFNFSLSSGKIYSDRDCLNQYSDSFSIPVNQSIRSFYFKNTTSSISNLSVTGFSLNKIKEINVLPAQPKKIEMSHPDFSKTTENFNNLTIRVTDEFGNTSFGATNNIALSSYSDPSCSVPTPTPLSGVKNKSLVNGSVIFDSVQFRKAGSIYIFAQSDGLPGKCSGEIVVSPSVFEKLDLSKPNDFFAGSCSSKFTVSVNDLYDNKTVHSEDVSVVLFGKGSSSIHRSADCSDEASSSITINSGQSGSDFYIKSSMAEDLLLIANASGKFSPSRSISILPKEAAKLDILGSKLIQAQECSPAFQIKTTDIYGNTTKTNTELTVLLSIDGLASLYLDGSCSNPGSSVKILDGESSAFVYIKGQTAETVSITASSGNDLTPKVFDNIKIAALGPTKLRILGQENIIANSCNQYAVKTEDVFFNESPVQVDKLISVTKTGTGRIYGTADCSGSEISSVIVRAGESFSNFYYKTTKSGADRLSVTGLLNATGGLDLSVSPLANSRLGFLSEKKELSAGQCSGVVILQSQDLYENPVPVGSDLEINLFGQGISYFQDSLCSVPVVDSKIKILSGQNTARFHIIGTNSNTNSILASSSFGSGSQDIVINASSPKGVKKKALPSIGSPNTISSFTSPIEFSVVDTYGNTVKSASNFVTISSFSDQNCLSPTLETSFVGDTLVPASSGIARFTEVAYDFPETIFVKASSPQLDSDCVGPVLISESVPSSLEIRGPAEIPAGRCEEIKIMALSRFSTPVNVLEPVLFGLSAAPSVVIYDSAMCENEMNPAEMNIASGSSSKSFWIKENKAKILTITESSVFGNITKLVSISPNSPTKVGIVFLTEDILLNRCEQASVSKLDEFDNESLSQNQETVLLSGSGSFYSDSLCLNQVTSSVIPENSSSKTIYYKNGVYGLASVFAQGLGGSRTTQVNVLRPEPSSLRIDNTVLSEVTAGQCFPLKVNTLDSESGLLDVNNDYEINLLGLGDEQGGFYLDSSCSGEKIISAVIPSQQNEVILYSKILMTGDYSLSVKKAEISSQAVPVKVNSDAVASINFSSNPPRFVSRGKNEISITGNYFDQYGNIVKDMPRPITVSLIDAVTGESKDLFFDGDSKTKLTDSNGSVLFSGMRINASGKFRFNLSGEGKTKNSDYDTLVSAEVTLAKKIFEPFSSPIRGDVAVTEKNLIFGVPSDESCGVVYVYKNESPDRSITNYTFSQKLKPKICVADSLFGQTIAEYGPYLLVGAPGYAGETGQVMVYKKDPSTGLYVGLNQTTDRIISPTNPEVGEQFGTALSISGDYFVISSPGKSSKKGEVGVYSYSSDLTSINRTQTLNMGADSVNSDLFGLAVSLYSGFGQDKKGGFLAVSYPGRNNFTGGVSVYRLSNGLFSEKQDLPGLIQGLFLSEGDSFGASLSLFGPYLAVGSPGANQETGRVLLFKNINYVEPWMNNRLNNWSSGLEIQAAGITPGSGYGTSVKIFGNYLLVGAPSNVSNYTGSVFLFEKKKDSVPTENIESDWTNKALFVSEYQDTNPGAFAADNTAGFGNRVALFDNKVVVPSQTRGFISEYVVSESRNTWPFGFDGKLNPVGNLILKSNRSYDYSEISIPSGSSVKIDSSNETEVGFSIFGSYGIVNLIGGIESTGGTNSGLIEINSPNEYGISSGSIISSSIVSGFGGKGGMSGTISGGLPIAGKGGDGASAESLIRGGISGTNGGSIYIKTNSDISGSGSFNLSGGDGEVGSDGLSSYSIDNQVKTKLTGTCSVFDMSFSRITQNSCYSTWSASPREVKYSNSISRFVSRYGQNISGMKLQNTYHVIGEGFNVNGLAGWNSDGDADCIKLLKAGLSFSEYPGTDDLTIQTSFGNVKFSDCTPTVTPGDSFSCDEVGSPQRAYNVKFSCNYISGESILGCASAGGGGGGGGSAGSITIDYTGENSSSYSYSVLGGLGKNGGNPGSPSSCFSTKGSPGENGANGFVSVQKKLGNGDQFIGESVACSVENGSGTKKWNGFSYNSCSEISCSVGYHNEFGKCSQNTKACSIDNGTGEKTWDFSFGRYGYCEAKTCNADFDKVSGYCVPKCQADEHRNESGLCEKNRQQCLISNGIGEKTWNFATNSYGSCLLKSCDSYYSSSSGSCIPNTRSCFVSNGNGVEFFDSTSSEFRGCESFACSSGFHKEGAFCLSNVKQCFVQNGVGEQSWITELGTYGSCSPISCSENYEIKNGECSPKTIACTPADLMVGAISGTKTFNGETYGACAITSCSSSYLLITSSNECYRPKANPDNFSAQENVVSNLDVLSNDIVSEGISGLTNQISIVSGDYVSSTGTSVSYFAPQGVSGAKSFTYKIVSSFGGKTVESESASSSVTVCGSGTHLEGGSCTQNIRSCSSFDQYGTLSGIGTQSWDNSVGWGACSNLVCSDGFHKAAEKCEISFEKELISSGHSHTCKVSSQGKIICWGSNEFGKLGTDQNLNSSENTSFPYMPFVPVNPFGSEDNFISVSAGNNHTCGLTDNGIIKCWGSNSDGQLGIASSVSTSSSPEQIKNASGSIDNIRYIQVSSGGNHTCALTSDRLVRCWGRNSEGQLGNGLIINSNYPVDVLGVSGVSMISSGEKHSCSVGFSGIVKCWGINDKGQLGVSPGSSISFTPPGSGSTSYYSPVPVSVLGLTGVKSISAGTKHSCSLLIDGSIKCWGDNSMGQLGNGEISGGGFSAVQVSLISGAISLDAGAFHNCAITSSNGVKCWGENSAGQLGNGITSLTGSSFAASVINFKSVEKSGLTSVSSGFGHTCSLSSFGITNCWGDNGSGQIGYDYRNEIDSSKSLAINIESPLRIIENGYSYIAFSKPLKISNDYQSKLFFVVEDSGDIPGVSLYSSAALNSILDLNQAYSSVYFSMGADWVVGPGDMIILNGFAYDPLTEELSPRFLFGSNYHSYDTN